MTIIHFFNGFKYTLNQGRWKVNNKSRELLSHHVWNYYNPDNPLIGGEAIHHINNDKSDDRPKNLKKMTRGEHTSLHSKGINHQYENNPMYGKYHREESKQKMRKPKSEEAKQNMRKPKSPEGRKNIKLAQNRTDVKRKISEAQKGSKNHNWKGGIKHKKIYMWSRTMDGIKCELYQTVNSLGEVLIYAFY